MDNESSWYEKIAKSGFLGTKAKVSAEAGKAEWSHKKEEPKPQAPQLEAMKRRQAKAGF